MGRREAARAGPRDHAPLSAGSHTPTPATLTPPFPGVRLAWVLCAPGVRASVANPPDLRTLQSTRSPLTLQGVPIIESDPCSQRTWEGSSQHSGTW